MLGVSSVVRPYCLVVLRARFGLMGLVCLVSACVSTQSVPAPPSTEPSTSTTTTATTLASHPVDWHEYVAKALDLLEENYYQPEAVDWAGVREAAWDVLGGESTGVRAHNAIKAAIREMRAAHTFFISAADLDAVSNAALELPASSGMLISDRIGYLYLPGTSGSGETGRLYATTLQESVRESESAGACGWVIDLRDNGGGSMVPMLLGVGPFLGNGVFLTTLRPTTGETDAYSYRSGELLVNGEAEDFRRNFTEEGMPADQIEALLAAFRLYTSPVELADPGAPVAVLTSFQTASAGEAVVIAFHGRSDTRFFGEPTLGVPTGNGAWYLEDGSVLVITGSVLVDRTGMIYDGSIQPDEIVIQLPSTETDETLDAALRWLNNQPACGP